MKNKKLVKNFRNGLAKLADMHISIFAQGVYNAIEDAIDIVEDFNPDTESIEELTRDVFREFKLGILNEAEFQKEIAEGGEIAVWEK